MSRPTRLVFVGREVEHACWTLTQPARGVVPAFVDHRGADVLDRVAEHRPDVVVVFAPDRLPARLARELDAITVACVADPVRLEHGDPQDPWAPGDDLGYAVEVSGGLGHLDRFDPAEYDRVLAADPLLARAAPHLDVWRSPPLPVDDALYLPPRPPTPEPHALTLGESSPRAESMLVEGKHYHDLSHYAFGLAGERLRDVLARTNVGVVVHRTNVPTFESTAALHLAAGHLLVTEPLVPPRGLEPWLDHLIVEAPDQVRRVLYQLTLRPRAFEQVRLRGRLRAEELRASRVWPRLVHDLMADVAASV